MSPCTVSFFGEGQSMVILTGLPFWASIGFNAPSTTLWRAGFLSLKDDGTGLNNHSATAPLHFLPRVMWLNSSSGFPPIIVPLCLRHLILLPAFCVILWTLQPRLTYRWRMLTCYLPKFSWMRKLTFPPPPILLLPWSQEGIKASKPSISRWWIKEIINLSYKKAGCVSAINVRRLFMRGISASWAEKAKASACSLT